MLFQAVGRLESARMPASCLLPSVNKSWKLNMYWELLTGERETVITTSLVQRRQMCHVSYNNIKTRDEN